MGPQHPLTIQPHIFKWRKGRKTDNTGKGAALHKALFLRQQPIMVLQKPLQHISGSIHNSACNHLHEFICCVCYCFIWLFSGWLLYSFNESVSPWKSCLVKYGVTFTVTYVVLSPPRHNVLGLAVQFLFSGKLRGWSSSSKSTHTCLRAVTLFYFQPLWPHFGNQICVFLPLLSLQIYAHSITSPNVFL